MLVQPTDWANHACPAVGALTLYRGWSTGTTALLRTAAASVVKKNPPLGGSLVKSSGGIEVKFHVHADPVRVLDRLDSFSLRSKLAEQMYDMHTYLEPHFLATGSIGSGDIQLRFGGPLFRITVLPLRNDLACLWIELSHVLGDTCTFYRIVAALNAELGSSQESVSIKWGRPICLPFPRNVTSGWDLAKYLLPSISWQVQSWLGWIHTRQTHIELLESGALADCKQIASHSALAGYVSTDDILTSAVAEVADASITVMLMNMRGRFQISEATLEYAGNGFRNVAFPSEMATGVGSCQGPAFLRDHVKAKGHYFEANTVPTWPYLRGSVAVITNWASAAEFCTPPGEAVVLAQVPVFRLQSAPHEMCIIFQPAPLSPPAILHNLSVDDRSFQERALRSSWWQYVVPMNEHCLQGSTQITRSTQLTREEDNDCWQWLAPRRRSKRSKWLV